MTTLDAKRQAYMNVIRRLQEMRAAACDDGLREALTRRIASEKRLLLRLDEVKKK